MMPDLRQNRKCGPCSECCKGTLTGEIYGRFMDRGMPCHFLGGEGCTIYEKRPDLCRNYKCHWLEDDGTNIPEWMRPDLSKVIMTNRSWGPNNEHGYLSVAESGQKIDSTILNWVYMHISKHNICANIEVDGRWYQMGPPEFVEYIRNCK